MSLTAIREVRLTGRKPGAVLVLIGAEREPLMDGFAVVLVREGDQPARMDWRPMLGVVAAVLTVKPLPHLTLAVLDALRGAGAKLFGAASDLGVFPLLENADEEHERMLRHAWELACQC